MQQRDHSEEAMQRRARTVINAAQRRTRRLQAMPAWADKKEIRRFYDLAQQRSKETGTLHHVDHIIPLIHPLVCGLHVPANLRVVPFRVNLRKSNKFHMEN